MNLKEELYFNDWLNSRSSVRSINFLHACQAVNAFSSYLCGFSSHLWSMGHILTAFLVEETKGVRVEGAN